MLTLFGTPSGVIKGLLHNENQKIRKSMLDMPVPASFRNIGD